MRFLTEAVNRAKIERFLEGRDSDLLRLKYLVQDLNDSQQISIETDGLEENNIDMDGFRRKLMEIRNYLKDGNLYEDYSTFKSWHVEIFQSSVG